MMMMKNRNYWTYSQRHPRPRGPVSPGELLYRAFDRLDDGIISLAVRIELRRMERRHLRMGTVRHQKKEAESLTALSRQCGRHIEPAHRYSA